MLLTHELLQTITAIAQRAGEQILQVYHRSGVLEVITKTDASPVTEADLRANKLIVSDLLALAPDIPVLSEESVPVLFEERRHWSRFWLVDPLDGTREFLSRNGEFTVNIALIENGVPVLGVVHVPVTGVSYMGMVGQYAGAWRSGPDGVRRQIRASRLPAPEDWKHYVLRVVASRRHGEQALHDLLETLATHFADIQRVSMGSSLKMCLLAEGLADFYPRLAPTCEWDTAAAHAILSAAGGAIVDEHLRPLAYNQRQSMLNPHFLAIADNSGYWEALLPQQR